jgi:hypothetical protein
VTTAVAAAFVGNLKLFNAKERDHLMRFAYLGQTCDYPEGTTFLSEAFDDALRVVANVPESATCVFAGMDYHLDWVFAALWLASHRPGWPDENGERVSEPMDEYEAEGGIKDLYTDFRPLTGSQEDIDLLVVYAHEGKWFVLFIEAKGSASFDNVQLARKVIRLNHILDESRMGPEATQVLEFRLILTAPAQKKIEDISWSKLADGLPNPKPGDKDKFEKMRGCLKRAHEKGPIKQFQFMPLGVPATTYAIERVREDGLGAFTHWTLRKRK